MIRITKVGPGRTRGMKFEVDSVVRGDFLNTVPVHPTEDGFSVTDHVLHEMDQVAVTVILGVSGGDFTIDGGRESSAGGSSVENVTTSTGEVWTGKTTRSQINASYKFLKDLLDDGDVVGVNLNYYDMQMFSTMVIKSLSAIVGEHVLTCTITFSEIRRATLETKQIDVIKDKDDNILYYPEGVPSATETMSVASASMLLPGDADKYLNKLVAASEITPLPADDPNASKISFTNEPVVVTKQYSVKFLTGQRKSVSFEFTSDIRNRIYLSVYWDGACTQTPTLSGFGAELWDIVTGKNTYGIGKCNGFSGIIGKSESYKVTDPITGETLFTIFIRNIEHTIQIFLMYLTANIWVYDQTSGSLRHIR